MIYATLADMAYIDVEARLRTALTTVIVDEYSLLETVHLPLPASERVIAHQLAWRLRVEYERGWDIDVEYNRAGHGSDPRTESKPDVQRPVDVSVHHRGYSGREHNLLVLELKVAGVPDLAGELERLAQTSRRYGYQHAVLLDLGLEQPAGDLHDVPLTLEPQWCWLPGGSTMVPVFGTGVAEQLARDGLEARSRRYPWNS